MKNRYSIFFLTFIALFVTIAIVYYLYIHRGDVSTDDAAISGRSVRISPKVAGYIHSLEIADNQFVRAGDILLEIDPADYVIRRDKAQAAYEAAQAAVSASRHQFEVTNISAPSNLEAAQSQVESAKASWDKAGKELTRMQRLSNEARSQEQLDQAIAFEKAAKAKYYETRSNLRIAETAPRTIAAAQASISQLIALLKQAQADLLQAETDLNNTKLIAPMDGHIAKRGIERGDYVQPGQQLASLIGTELWVVANFKETQLEHILRGQPVTINVDGFPDIRFNGKVDSIQLATGAFFSAFPPENATGNFVKVVQRVPIKIVFDNIPDSSLALGLGMSVVTTINTLEN